MVGRGGIQLGMVGTVQCFNWNLLRHCTHRKGKQHVQKLKKEIISTKLKYLKIRQQTVCVMRKKGKGYSIWQSSKKKSKPIKANSTFYSKSQTVY